MTTLSQEKDMQYERASANLENGAVTPGYKADRATVLRLLNEALATELVCVLRYKHHYFIAEGSKGRHAAEEFLEHAEQEQAHADKVAKRIVQLGGNPRMSPEALKENSHLGYVEGHTLRDMLRENLVAERVAIDTYREFISTIGDDDPTTRRILEEILAQEEEHADDLASLMQDIR